MSQLGSLARRAAHGVNLRRRIDATRARRLHARMAGPRLIAAFAEAFPRAVFVEVGANDGEQHDPLRRAILESDWRGVMVEPVPYVFERLRRNYGTIDRVEIENAAVADRDGRLPFYHLAEAPDWRHQGLPQWYDGIGSFSRETVLDHARLIPDIADRLVTSHVPCVTFDALCQKHGLTDVDLVLIDTEGYDFEILRHIDLTRHRPALLVYEHYHLGSDERRAAIAHIRAAGYETMEEGFDTWCVRPDANPDLTRAWRTLRPAVPAVVAEDEPR